MHADIYNILAQKLDLSLSPAMQDWPWEVANAEQLPAYLQLYDNGTTTDEERVVLMEMMLQASEDRLEIDTNFVRDPLWLAVKEKLTAHSDLHTNTLSYWKSHPNFVVSTYL